MEKVVVFIINLYQKTISFDHGPLSDLFPFLGCRYYPSCSEYSKQAIISLGFFKGVFRSIRRILSCHPLSHGGYDPVRVKNDSSNFGN